MPADGKDAALGVSAAQDVIGFLREERIDSSAGKKAPTTGTHVRSARLRN
eukprot:CAMPEP_0115835400 /NCGR_PEP_ID=MMETSP0287-20121206/4174_1 /TAXON_ID=412157 /ORGANISM="Chrysochromulina rotalis, Strain UIO044" /LENGTH=49 /DNA_ID=CAMNT_0003288855 /DNA_START=1474 /DNA_END=1623 /DNA_ORIENTATION=+